MASTLEPVLYTDATHTYTAPGGKWLPGVTRILSGLGYNGSGADFFTPESRQRGQAVHYACRLADQYCPDALTLEAALSVIDLDERLHPYLSGYLWFKREKGFKPIHNELPVWSRKLNAAGTLDKWGTYSDGTRVLVDLKSWKGQGATPKRASEIQTAGYALMAKESMGLDTDLRVVIALPGDGKYRSYDCTKPRDAAVFQACCIVYWDLIDAGLLKGGGESEVELAA